MCVSMLPTLQEPLLLDIDNEERARSHHVCVDIYVFLSSLAFFGRWQALLKTAEAGKCLQIQQSLITKNAQIYQNEPPSHHVCVDASDIAGTFTSGYR